LVALGAGALGEVAGLDGGCWADTGIASVRHSTLTIIDLTLMRLCIDPSRFKLRCGNASCQMADEMYKHALLQNEPEHYGAGSSLRHNATVPIIDSNLRLRATR
jgi:hypothetical protein